jgi:ribosomal protein S18 acetylase RimI-like enzyme
MNPRIRIANAEDMEAIVSLVNSAYRPSGEIKGWTHESKIVEGLRVTVEQVQALLVPNSVIFVAEQGLELLACVHLHMENNCAHIGMLATNPNFQENGYGKKMLAHAENYAVENFSANKFEMVVISERVELVSFYLRRGYQKTGRVNGYPVSAGVGIPKVQGLTIEVLQKCG